MALTDLLSAIESDADDQLRSARESAELEATAILEQARGQADRHAREVRRRSERDAEVAVAQVIADAEAWADQRFRSAREQALDEVRDRAWAALADVRGNQDYPAAFARLLDQALAQTEQPTRVHVDPGDRTLAVGLLPDRGGLELVADLATAGGVVVESPGRRTDNTLEVRFEAAWPQLRSTISRGWDRAGPVSAGGAP